MRKLLLTCLLWLACSPALAINTFTAGVAGNPYAPLFGRHDTDTTNSWVQSGNYTLLPRIASKPVQCTDGSWLVFVEGRQNESSDAYTQVIMMRRTRDNGHSWDEPRIVHRQTDYANGNGTPGNGSYVNGPACTKSSNGTLILVYTHTLNQVLARVSTDNGYTWGSETDITASVVKVDATHPANQPSSYTLTGSEADPWLRVFTVDALTLANGRCLFSLCYRYTSDTSGTSRTALFYSDNHGATFALAPAWDANTAGNNGMNETTMCQTANGTIWATHRIIGTNARGFSSSTDNGATWNAMTTSTIASNSTLGGITAVGNTLYTSYVSESSTRAYMAVASSTDGTAWSNVTTIFPNRCGYSQLATFDSSTLCLVYERMHDFIGYGSSSVWQEIAVCRFPPSWIAGNTSAIYADYPLNEAVSTAISALGTPIHSQGPIDQRGFGGTNFQYSSANNGIISIADNDSGVILAKTQGTGRGTCFDPGLGSGTYEIEFQLDGTDATSRGDGTTRVLFDSRNNTTNAKGVTATLTTLNRINMTVDDGTTQRGMTNTTAITDGNVHRASFVYNRGGTCVAYRDGVAGAAVSDTLNASTSIVGAQHFCLGAAINGTATASILPANAKILRFKFTPAALTSAQIIGAQETKTSLASYSGYASTPSTTVPAVADGTIPSSISGLKLWMGTTADGGRGASTDDFGGWEPHHMPPSVGQGFSTYRDAALGNFFGSGYWWWEWNKYVGLHWRFAYNTTTTTTAKAQRSAAANTYDFIHETGTFTVAGWFRINSNNGDGAEIIIDNASRDAGNNGFTFWRNSANRLAAGFYDGDGGALLENTSMVTGALFNNSTWCYLALVGNAGTVTFYHAIPEAAPKKIRTWTISAYATGTFTPPGAGTKATSKKFTIGCREDGAAYDADLSIKDLVIYDTNLSSAQLMALANYSVPDSPQPHRPAVSNGLKLGGIRKVPEEYTLAP